MIPAVQADALADLFMGLWEEIDGSTATIPLVRAMRMHFDYKDLEVYHSTTARAYESLCKGNADLIFVTPPSPEDLEIARVAGVELEVIPIAREALVFLNNTQNPVKSLTLAQLRGMYTGRVQNWREVGGEDEAIVPYQREPRSGSQTLFLACLMGDEEPLAPEKELVIASMGQLIDRVASYTNAPNTLGYSVFYYATQMYKSESIRILAVDGVMPSAQSIADGTYPLCTNYYAVLRKDTEPGDPARGMVAWLLSEEGQRMVTEAGYVPMTGDVPDEGEEDAEARACTHHSSGTGGTELREQTPYGWYEYRAVDLPEDVREMADAWLVQAAKELGIDESARRVENYEGEAFDYSPTSSAILNLALYDGDEDFQNFRLRSTVIDIENLCELKLSDVFYDGFNYIDYINNYIALMPDVTNINSNEESFPPDESTQKSVFSGLPNDYSYFAVYPRLSDGNFLEILYDSVNPFWQRDGYGWPQVFVPLGHWISPWGGCTVETTYQNRLLPGDIPFSVPSLRIDDGREPEAEAKINAALAVIAERHTQEQAQWALDQKHWVENRVTFGGHYAMVNFDVMVHSEWGGKTLSHTLFHLHTGESLDVREFIARWKDAPEAVYYRSFYSSREEREVIPGYQLPENLVYRYVGVSGEMLSASFVDDEKGWVTALFPLSLLEQVD